MKDDEGASGSPDDPETADRPPDEPSESNRTWRFTLEDIDQREAEAAAAAEAEARRNEPIEAGEPSLEGIAFVLLGVVFTLFIISRLLVG